MPLSPQDIVRKEFREAFRGYNQSDVDLFLDEVVEEYGRLFEENQRLKTRLMSMQQEMGRARAGAPPGEGPSTDSERGGERDPRLVDSEVRARLRRFFEEQIRALDAAEQHESATVERMRRDLSGESGPPPE